MNVRVIFILIASISLTIGEEPEVSKSQFSELLSNLLSKLPNDENLSFGNPDEMKRFLIDQYDNEYNSNCKCGKRKSYPRDTSRIVDGYEANPNEFPWQVQIQLNQHGSGQYIHTCGGTLISKRWVLTAEHCLRDPTTGAKVDKSGYRVILGEHNRTVDEGTELEFTIKQVIYHPSYQNSNGIYSYDFSLIELSDEVNFNREISPACLPVDVKDQFVDMASIASGWGDLFMGGPKPENLNYAELNVLDNSNCGSNVDIEDYHLCATGVNKYGVLSDTCKGDSGGPLVTKIDGRWTLIGVVSYGVNCSEPAYPGVYARVTSVLDWIHQETQLEPCDHTATWTQWSDWSGYVNGKRIRMRQCDEVSHNCIGDSIDTEIDRRPGKSHYNFLKVNISCCYLFQNLSIQS